MPLGVPTEGSGDARGLFINKIKPTNIKDVSGQTVNFGSTAKVLDLAVELKYPFTKKDGETVEFSKTIGGDFFRDKDTGEVKFWSAAEAVFWLYVAAGIGMEECGPLIENNDYKIPPSILALPVGKEFKVLRYRSAKSPGKYYDWKKIFPASVPDEQMKEAFLAAIAKDDWLAGQYASTAQPAVSSPGEDPGYDPESAQDNPWG